MWSQATKFKPRAIALACAAVLAGCGGGSGGSDGALVQAIDFQYPGGMTVGAPGTVATTKLVATATGGGPVTFSTNTPDACTVSGDTLSLVKAGECSVTASQAGGNGYAPALARQLFVIPKIKTAFTFPNPGWQPLDTTPVQLSATSAKGFPISFASKTPDVCTVNGTTLSKVGNGVCTVTATATGDDFYATMTVNKNIPIGTATAPNATTPYVRLDDDALPVAGAAPSGAAQQNQTVVVTSKVMGHLGGNSLTARLLAPTHASGLRGAHSEWAELGIRAQLGLCFFFSLYSSFFSFFPFLIFDFKFEFNFDCGFHI